MIKKCKRTFFLAFGIAVFGFFGAVNAQVFSPRAANAPTNTASEASKVSGLKQNQADEKADLQNNAPVANEAIVKKNFSGEEKKVEYDNSTPKIVSFKIVNGEVVLDENKERSVLVYYDNYEVFRGLDDYVRCSLRIYVLNDLTEKITSLGFKLYWPQISTSVQMNQLNPGVSTYKDIMLMGDGCFALEGAPTIEVNRCRVKNMSQEKCADAIKWYQKP